MAEKHWEYNLDSVAADAREFAETVASTGGITKAQAEAYAFRGWYGVTRKDAAEVLGKKTSTIDTHFGRAEAKIQQAIQIGATLDQFDSDKPGDPPGDTEEFIKQLSGTSLTQSQAQVYGYRIREGMDRQEVAEKLGNQPSTVDTLLAKAQEKIHQAEEIRSVLGKQEQPVPAIHRVQDIEREGKPGEEHPRREPPERRSHETYFDSDHWTIVDMEGVDSVFVTSTQSPGGENDTGVRLDLDGTAHLSSEPVEAESNLNSSIWLTREWAEKLYADLGEELGKSE